MCSCGWQVDQTQLYLVFIMLCVQPVRLCDTRALVRYQSKSSHYFRTMRRSTKKSTYLRTQRAPAVLTCSAWGSAQPASSSRGTEAEQPSRGRTVRAEPPWPAGSRPTWIALRERKSLTCCIEAPPAATHLPPSVSDDQTRRPHATVPSAVSQSQALLKLNTIHTYMRLAQAHQVVRLVSARSPFLPDRSGQTRVSMY